LKNARQLKDIIKNMSFKTGIKANAILQNFMLEILVEYIAASQYKKNFILKGGMLISSMVGISSRTTMDIDATIKGIDVTKENILKVFNEILNSNIYKNFSFEIVNIKDIREEDQYGGIRLSIMSKFETSLVPLKVDISTGDIITPGEISYTFKSLFENKFIEIYAYNIETILAEKFETIISRGILNTRARDFYDIYILMSLRKQEINQQNLKQALLQTSNKRGTLDQMDSALDIINQIKLDKTLQDIWKMYSKKFEYANELLFDSIIEKLIELYNMLQN